MRLRRFFNPEPRKNLGKESGSLNFLSGFRLKTLFLSESLGISPKIKLIKVLRYFGYENCREMGT